MNLNEVKSIIIERQSQLSNFSGIKREYEEDVFHTIGSKPLKIITGFRRSGKSFLVQQIASRLIKEKIFTPEDILYLNFEDYKLSKYTTLEQLDEIVNIFNSLPSSRANNRKLYIFDEIQNIKNWDKFIRTIYEFNVQNKYDIILTGSNSELLSSELGSNLAGRFIEFHILPFSFREFLEYKNITVENENNFYRNKKEINLYFQEYITFGGLPEIFSINNIDAKYSYLKGILSKVILDDLIKRFNPKHPIILDKLVQYQLENIGNIISTTNIHKYIISQGHNLDINSFAKYIDFIPKTFTLYELNKFDWKTKKVFNTSKKFYSVDLGLTNLYKPLVNNLSKQLENLVFLKLLSEDNLKSLHYGFSSNKEIDFIVENRKREFTKYQVTQELNKTNEARELSAFISDDEYLNKSKNILLTLDDDEKDFTYKKTKIKKRNIVKWLLGL